MRFAALAALAFALTALARAQQPQQFVPFTIDAEKFAQVDAAMAKASMPRDAHAAWLNLWNGLEEQARRDQAIADAKHKADEAAKSAPK